MPAQPSPSLGGSGGKAPVRTRFAVLINNSNQDEVVLHVENTEDFTLPNKISGATSEEPRLSTMVQAYPTLVHIEGRLSMVPPFHDKGRRNLPIYYTPSDMHRRPLQKLAKLIDFSNDVKSSFQLLSGYFGDLTSGPVPVTFQIASFKFRPGSSRNLIDYTLDLQDRASP